MTRREIIAARIRERREALGLSQADLARSVGVERQQVSQWEKGASKPSEDHFFEVARTLQTSISFLYGEVDDHRPAREWPSNTAAERAQDAARLLREALARLEGQAED